MPSSWAKSIKNNVFHPLDELLLTSSAKTTGKAALPEVNG
jgi:hypothetical protein